MIQFKPLDKQYEWEWIWQRAHPMQVEDSQGIVAYEDTTGAIAGVVIMDSWTPSGCQTHFAIDNPICIRRGLFREVAYHIHVVCARRYIFGLVPANNVKALNFDFKMGFEKVATVPEGYDTGVDYIVLRLAKENNRWLGKEFREQEAA